MRTRKILLEVNGSTKGSPESRRKAILNKLLRSRKVDVNGCWLFTGSVAPNGYGKVTFNYRTRGVHRLSAWLWLGLSLDSEYQANHKPICPNKHCFNPDHLYIGNQSENILDVLLSDKFPCGHPRNDTNTYTYISSTKQKYKWCRLCRNKSRRKQ